MWGGGGRKPELYENKNRMIDKIGGVSRMNDNKMEYNWRAKKRDEACDDCSENEIICR